MLARLLNIKKRQQPEAISGEKEGHHGVLQVTSDATRCVQCGICGYNCPVGIEVREYARRGENVTDSRCINCGACVEKCPRGTLKWGPAVLLGANNALEIAPDALPLMLQLKPRKQR